MKKALLILALVAFSASFASADDLITWDFSIYSISDTTFQPDGKIVCRARL